MTPHFSPVITAHQLSHLLDEDHVIILDCRNHNHAETDYQKEHIQGAYFVDVNFHLAATPDISGKGGRHPLPSVNDFCRTLTLWGITPHHHVIAYDDKNGSNAAARLWWMLKSAGHKKIQVLEGAWNDWKKILPFSQHLSLPKAASEHYHFSSWQLPVTEKDEVQRAAEDPNQIIIDVRDESRFLGIHEPIDKKAGHIPGAINLPFTRLMKENGEIIEREMIRQTYEPLIKKFGAENITMHCGSGVTACFALLALDKAQLPIPKLYVGSWSDWISPN